MIKVNIQNAQKQTERLINQLERGDEAAARRTLAKIRKSAYDRMRYTGYLYDEASDVYLETGSGGIDVQIQKAQYKKAKKEFEQIAASVNEIRSAIRNPDSYSFKEDRGAYYSLQRAFGRINAIQEKRAAEREIVYKAMSEAQSVEGISLTNIRRSQKLEALFTNVIYNNALYNFNKADLEDVDRKIRAITGYSVIERFQAHFDQPSHYESGGDEKQTSFFDKVKDISAELRAQLQRYQSSENFATLEEQVNKFLRMAGV